MILQPILIALIYASAAIYIANTWHPIEITVKGIEQNMKSAETGLVDLKIKPNKNLGKSNEVLEKPDLDLMRGDSEKLKKAAQ